MNSVIYGDALNGTACYSCPLMAGQEPQEAPQRFRDNLNLLIEHDGRTQKEIAKGVGELVRGIHFSQAWLSNVLSGERDCPTRIVKALSEFLKQPIEMFWMPTDYVRNVLHGTPAPDKEAIAEAMDEGAHRPISETSIHAALRDLRDVTADLRDISDGLIDVVGREFTRRARKQTRKARTRPAAKPAPDRKTRG